VYDTQRIRSLLALISVPSDLIFICDTPSCPNTYINTKYESCNIKYQLFDLMVTGHGHSDLIPIGDTLSYHILYAVVQLDFEMFRTIASLIKISSGHSLII
jgi:hypothetical protein